MMSGVSAPASSMTTSLSSWRGAKGASEREVVCVVPRANRRASQAMLAQLPGSLEILLQLGGDFFGDIGAGAAELGAQALLRGGPDYVAVFVDEAHGGYGFMPPLGRVLRFVLANADSPIAS